MAKQKFYVVWNGAEDGVYTSWEACEAAVKGFSGAKYQAFKTEAEAEEVTYKAVIDFVPDGEIFFGMPVVVITEETAGQE